MVTRLGLARRPGSHSRPIPPPRPPQLPNLSRNALGKMLAAPQSDDAQAKARRVHQEIVEKRPM